MVQPAIAVIVNPAAAGGRVGRHWATWEASLRTALGDATFYHTARTGDGIGLAVEAARAGAGHVLSLGGDGTHSEVVNGLMQLPVDARPSFGLLPAGTGGDLKRLLRAHNTIAEAATLVRAGVAVPVDVGEVQFETDDGAPASRFFINIASMGVSGLVCRRVNVSRKRFGGRITFFQATLGAIRAYTPATVRLTVDGQDLGIHRVTNVAVANGRYFGGGMCIAPEALLDDGLLDVTLIHDAGLVGALRLAPAVYGGSTRPHPLLLRARGAEISVEMVANQAWMDIDGEAPGVGPATFVVHRHALRMHALSPQVLRPTTHHPSLDEAMS